MDFRKVFDSIPEEFDKWRTRYCDELFTDLIDYTKLDLNKSVLEIGPGTGQATEPILKTNCSYLGIELGEHLASFTENKFSSYENFNIINADFETYDFEQRKFDLVYSAATIQWIPEEIAFPKVFNLLKSNGTLAMMMTHTDHRAANEKLDEQIQEVYKRYFHPQAKYTCHLEYNNVDKYGFVNFERREYRKARVYNADEYISYIRIHASHLTLQEPYKTKFYEGIREAIQSFDNKITLNDTIILYLTRKP